MSARIHFDIDHPYFDKVCDLARECGGSVGGEVAEPAVILEFKRQDNFELFRRAGASRRLFDDIVEDRD